MRRVSALDRPSVRDEAMLAEVLRTLQFHLEQEQGASAPSATDVEDVVARAVAELQRLNGPRPIGGIAPVLGAGVVQELLRRRKELPPQSAATHRVDATR